MSGNLCLHLRTSLGKVSIRFGTWRSLVAHLTGGQGVAGSNPVVPTIEASRATCWLPFFVDAEGYSVHVRVS